MDSTVLSSNRESNMSWKAIFGEDPQKITYQQAGILLAKLACQSEENAALARDVMGALSEALTIAQGLARAAQNPKLETYAHNVRIYGELLQQFDPQPDGDY